MRNPARSCLGRRSSGNCWRRSSTHFPRKLAAHRARTHVFDSLTVSRSAFPALNDGAVEAGMAMLTPVAGLRPWRADRLRVAKLPKPAMVFAPTLWPVFEPILTTGVPALDPAVPRLRRPARRQRGPAVPAGSSRCDGGAPLTCAARKPFPGPYFLHLSRPADFSEVVKGRIHSRMKSPTPERPYTTSPFAS